MATKLFELEADIILNSDQFATDLSDAVSDAQSLAAEIDALNKQPDTASGTKLSNVLDDAGSVYDKISDAKSAADGTEEKINQIREGGSSALSGLMDTFAGVAALLVESVVAGIFDVGASAIESAAAADSPLAEAYNKASENFALTQDLTLLEIGNALLPIATSIQQLTDNILSFVFRINDADKLTAYLDQLETYKADNLQKVSENLRSVFSVFQEIEKTEAMDFSDMSAGVVSQTRFWTDYATVLDSLRQRGVGSDFLSDIATGSYESLEQLMALDELNDADLQTFLASYEQLSAAREAAAESINIAQVDVATAAENVESTVAGMVVQLDQSEIAQINMSATTDSIVSVLSSTYPVIANHVDAINAKISELGNITPAYTSDALMQSYMSGASPYAYIPAEVYGTKSSGVDYVPYSGYEAELQPSADTVLQRKNVSTTAGSGIDPAILQQAVYDALSQWGQPVGANAFGAIISPQVSQNIALNTRGVR